VIRLVIDANVLVGELLRDRGRALLRDLRLDLLLTDSAKREAEHELNRRIVVMMRRGAASPETARTLAELASQTLDTGFRVVSASDYLLHETVARRRVPRDADDWPTVAAALAADASIWTNDGASSAAPCPSGRPRLSGWSSMRGRPKRLCCSAGITRHVAPEFARDPAREATMPVSFRSAADLLAQRLHGHLRHVE